MKKKSKPTENMLLVLEFLQGQPDALTADIIGQATGINTQAIHGIAGGLVNRGLVEKGDKVKMSIINKKGLKEERLYVTYRVTSAGLEYDPDQ